MLTAASRPGVELGDGCVIGAGSVVTKSVPAGHVAAGNPARVLRKVAHDTPEAPALKYERCGDREMVRSERGRESEYGGRTPVELIHPTDLSTTRLRQPPLVASQPAHDPQARHNAADQIPAARRTETGLHRLLRNDQAMTGLVGTDVLLLVASFVTAWLIAHILLY